MSDEFELVRGSDNPFRDVGIPDADTQLMKADLASGILGIMRERNMTATDAARVAEIAVADISRIRRGDLNRFTIDRLVKIHNRLDRDTRIRVDFSQSRDGGQAGAAHPWASVERSPAQIPCAEAQASQAFTHKDTTK